MASFFRDVIMNAAPRQWAENLGCAGPEGASCGGPGTRPGGLRHQGTPFAGFTARIHSASFAAFPFGGNVMHRSQ
jgi:hypothetical protein